MSSEQDLLRKMAADESVPAHLRLCALKELGRCGESAEATPSADGDPEAAMRAVVERHCPESPEMAKVAADPMRDLDFRAVTGRDPDPLYLSWAPYCPENPKRAEREIVAAARRLGVGRGPHEVPEGADELAARRRRRAG